MYQILIVDDEKMIREGIKKVIPWEKIGIGQVFLAASGEEALKIVEEHQPEIVITDISMTGLSGLGLIEQLKQKKPDQIVLVLTGYDRFEYARTALRLQVQEFLLKPIDEEELERAIFKQIQLLEQNEKEKQSQIHTRRTKGVYDQIQLEQKLRDLVHKRGEESEIVNYLQTYWNLDEKRGLQVVMLISAIYLESDPNQNYFQKISMKNVCMDFLDAQGKGITFMDDNGMLNFIFFEEDEEDILDRSNALKAILKDEFNVKVRIIIGSRVQGFANIPVSYNDMIYLYQHEQQGIHEIVQTQHDQNRIDIFRDLYAELKTCMCSNVGDVEYVMKVFRTFIKACESYNLSDSNVRKCCFEMATMVYFSYCAEAGVDNNHKLNALLESLLHAEREDALEVTNMFLTQLLEKEENVHELVAKAKGYIQEHLTDELSVSSIAEILYVTPNYFSRLFKKVTGEGCNEYIVRKRIEKAKFLLETTTIKTGKIALMVGYRDTNYFSLAFKKHVKLSPTRYRESFQKSG